MIENLEAEITKLDLEPGDIALLSLAKPLPIEVIERIREDLQRVLPQGAKVMILDAGMELEVREASA